MCTPSKHLVEWTLDSKFMNVIYKSLREDSDEIAGKIYFEDHSCGKNGICSKIIKDYTINNGDGASVMTPFGVVNFHTHPMSAYEGENAVYGWPSGEDMAQTLYFADYNFLVHLVFTVEGVYVINVKNNSLGKKDREVLEKVMKKTHIFRSENQDVQLKNFKAFLEPIYKSKKRTTVNLWLELVNNLTLKELYTLYNSFNKKIKVPENNDKIFEVKLYKNNKSVKFKANFITMKCHKKSFYG